MFFFSDEKPKPHEINTLVVPKCAIKWRELGEALRISSDTLDIINADHPNSVESRCKVMLRRWLQQDASATWSKLLNAMCSPGVSIFAVASVKGNSSIYF